MTREYTTRILSMMDDGLLEPKQLAENLLSWLSEKDAKEFYYAYELDFNQSEFGGDEEDDGQPSEMQEWHDFDPDC